MVCLLYGINKYSLEYYHEHSPKEELIFVSTQEEEKLGHKSLRFADAHTRFPDAEIIIFSSYYHDVTSYLINFNIAPEKVAIYYRSKKQPVPLPSLTMDKQFDHDQLLHCTYHLGRSFATFDFLLFLVHCELERRQKNLKYLKVYIVLPISSDKQDINLQDPHHRHGEHTDYQYIEDRVYGILEPLARCCPSVISSSVLMNNEYKVLFPTFSEKSRFPDKSTDHHEFVNFNYLEIADELSRSPGELEGFISAPARHIARVKCFLEQEAKGRKTIVFTLREYEHLSYRNTRILDWVKLINSLPQDEYFPVVVRDTYQVYTDFPESNAYFFNEASIDLCTRMAIYQLAYLNLSINCGPSATFYFLNNCRSIEFREANPDSQSTDPEHMYTASLMKEGEQPAYALEKNHVFWGKDSFENLNRAFYKYIDSL